MHRSHSAGIALLAEPLSVLVALPALGLGEPLLTTVVFPRRDSGNSDRERPTLGTLCRGVVGHTASRGVSNS
jgi:hypothetical protein